MMGLPLRLALGAALGLLIAVGGRRWRLLTGAGQIALAGTTLAVFGAQGWVWGVLIALYALCAGVVIQFRRPYKDHILGRASDQAAQGWLPVMARLGWPAALALLSLAGQRADYMLPFVGALAAASADIWATELGMLYRRDPLMLTTRRPAPPGTPGAISLLGVTAALGATWLTGFAGLVLASLQSWRTAAWTDRDLLWLPLAAMIGGMIGNLADSLLGATAQAIYYCEVCERYTDEPRHACGRPTAQVRGWPWMTNELVDLTSSVIGAAVTVGAALVLARSRWPW